MTPLEITLTLLVALLFLAAVYYWVRGRYSRLERIIRQISSEHKRHLLIPDGLDGHIELDYLLLTSHGLVVLDHREIHGTIFPGAQLDLWTVLQDNHRFSIQNPFITMRHRLNAVRALVQDVPVSGIVVFPDVATFGNEPPENVIKESDLLERFATSGKANTEILVKAFHQPYKYLSDTVFTE